MRYNRYFGAIWRGVLLASVTVGCGTVGPRTPAPPRFLGEAWSDADRLFQRDPRWVGGDGAYTVDLGGGRTLWLFGDSWIDPLATGERTSPAADMVSNTLAIQDGADPATATIEFFWGRDDSGAPAAYFPDHDGVRFWPGHGIRIRDRLFLFLMAVRGTSGGLGFEVYDWRAILVSNPDARPSDWDVRSLPRPANDLQVIVGSASVVSADGYVHAFSSREPSGHDVFLVRWREHDLYRGDLDAAEWWSAHAGWTAPTDALHDPTPVLRGAPTEFTVHRDARSGLFLQVQSTGFGSADLELSSAPALTGPWSTRERFYRPPEFDRPGVMIYQGKVHPQMHGADLVATYSTNCFDFMEMVNDPAVYFPRFVRLTRIVDP